MNEPKEEYVEYGFWKKLLRRRHYLVDPRRQLAATIRISGLVLVLLITINAAIARQASTITNQVMARNPELGEIMRATDHRNLAILAGISLIILAMVVIRSIMYTHRTAGAVFKVAQSMGMIATGDFDVTLRLRDDDSLRELEEPFNKMATALSGYADEDYRSMTKLADEIEEHGNSVDAEMLRRIAESRGRRAD
jgi:nitrogen fixation/metabolism regulation signal transduction histidine kinase